jgi:fumarylpyruvate hydrolase
VINGADSPYPSETQNHHHEIELVAAIGTGGKNIAVADAMRHVWGYAVGIDLTRRDLQEGAKKAARPWDWSKAFDRSAPCGPLIPAKKSGHPAKGRIWLAVDGKGRQDADLAELIWPVADIVSICSEAVELEPGDLIFTGTPAGVGAVRPGETMTGGVDGIGTIQVTIGQPIS